MAHRKVIDTINVRGLEPIKILYDLDDEMFKARVLETWFKDPLLVDLKKKINEEVERVVSAMYNWIPIIEVKENYSWRNEGMVSYVGFEIERYYVAQRENGWWMKSVWGSDERWRSCESFKESFEIPFEEDTYDREDKVFYMHYDEKKWIGFQHLTDAIHELKDRLRKLVGTEEGQKKIAQAGKLMLSWQKPKKGEKDVKA